MRSSLQGSDFDSESLQLALFPNSSSLECSLTCHFRRRFKITVRGPATNSRATVGRLAVGTALSLPLGQSFESPPLPRG
jgi:hypothetical protein